MVTMWPYRQDPNEIEAICDELMESSQEMQTSVTRWLKGPNKKKNASI